MSKWGKVQKLVAVKNKEPEEEEEEEPIYEIQEMPDPFRLKIIRPLNYFIQKAEFQDGETKGAK